MNYKYKPGEVVGLLDMYGNDTGRKVKIIKGKPGMAGHGDTNPDNGYDVLDLDKGFQFTIEERRLYSLDKNGSLNETLKDKIQKIINDEKLGYDIVEDDGHTVGVEVSGDWKHDHAYFNMLMRNNGINLTDEETTDDYSGDDSYKSIHYFAESVNEEMEFSKITKYNSPEENEAKDIISKINSLIDRVNRTIKSSLKRKKDFEPFKLEEKSKDGQINLTLYRGDREMLHSAVSGDTLLGDDIIGFLNSLISPYIEHNLVKRVEKLLNEDLEENADDAFSKLNDYVITNGKKESNYIILNVDNTEMKFFAPSSDSIIDDSNKIFILINDAEVFVNGSTWKNERVSCTLTKKEDKYFANIRVYNEYYNQEINPNMIKPEEILKFMREKAKETSDKYEQEFISKNRRKDNAQLDKQILEDLQNKGFKKCILRYTRIYDKIYEGRDEDGYPDFSYEFSDTDWDYATVRDTENKYEFGFELEYNRILISENEDQDSGDYPSGGTPDHITYSNYDVELRNRYYLVNDYSEELKMDVKDYILENYPDTYVASLLLSDKVDFDNENIIDDLDCEDF